MTAYRQKAAEDRRRRILDIAGEMFLDQGYEAVSTADLVRRIGGSKATLYSYFPSKADLFVAVVADQVEDVAGRFAPVLQAGGDLRETLGLIGRAMLTAVVSPQLLGLYRIGVSELYRHPSVAHELENLRRHLSEPVIAFFRNAAERGLLAIQDPELASDQFRELCGARHFNQLLFGLIDPPSEGEIGAAVDEAVDFFIKGYGGGGDQ